MDRLDSRGTKGVWEAAVLQALHESCTFLSVSSLKSASVRTARAEGARLLAGECARMKVRAGK